MIKRTLSFILALCFCISLMPFSLATAEPEKVILPSKYSSHMLFKQNEPMVIEGEAPRDSEISAELYKGEELIAQGTCTATHCRFEIVLQAPAGSYDKYTLIIKKDGVEAKKFIDVVFGELWLASGQSNMMYPLGQSKVGADWQKTQTELNPWVRAFYTPAYIEYKGSEEKLPVEPQNDIKKAYWVTGEYDEIYGVSAVGYFFADKLQKDLNMPVGILNLSLGGSNVASWLPREAVDNNEEVKSFLIENGNYIEKDDWNEDEQDVYTDIATNFNQRINPVKSFRLSGMIWYQGESNISDSDEDYFNCLSLLQHSYTKLFNYENGLLPFVCTQLAQYYYGDDFPLSNRNIAFSEWQKEEPYSRAVISIYDLENTYIQEVGSIHPQTKKPIGERMAFAAEGLVYGKRKCYTAPTVEKTTITDNNVFVTLNNTGDGLRINGEHLKGFTICGADGIYVEAQAEITDKNTVKVYSELIEKPESVAYAYGVRNIHANLYSSENGVITLPVSPFVTNNDISVQHWVEKPWIDCENETAWHFHTDFTSNFYSVWESENAEISYSENHAYSGTNGLSVKGTGEFSINPAFELEVEDGRKKETQTFNDTDKNYSNYGTMTVQVRNNTSESVSLKGVRFYVGKYKWYAPAIDNTTDVEIVIPGDSQWHTITFDLNRLHLFGNECGFSRPNDKLEDVENIIFTFESSNETTLSIDNIQFTPSSEEAKLGFNVSYDSADNIIEKISALFVGAIGKGTVS